MARKLTEKDIEILKKLSPECENIVCSGSGSQYRSIIPPVSNHYAKDEKDFEERFSRLSIQELKYLCDLIFNGSESLSCVPPKYAEVFTRILSKKLSNELAEKMRMFYESCEIC